MKIRAVTITLIIVFVAFFLLGNNTNSYRPPTPLPLAIPSGWPKPEKNFFEKNLLTQEGFDLGKKLFYDPTLSVDGEISCASCHQPFASFASYDHDLSHGVNNKFTKRNAPALINLIWMKELHWDGGINHLEVQPLSPLTSPDEMGEKLDVIIGKLRKDTAYVRLFKKAFNDTTISIPKMLKAMAQFTGSLISANSKYDKVKKGEASYTNYERQGYTIFKEFCNACHREPLFTDQSFKNNGMSINRFNDIGRQGITGNKKDSLKFKVPTLRNVSVTFPYMHDGSKYSLYQVIDHYTTEIDTTNDLLDPILKKKIVLTKSDKMNLISFLSCLTDSAFLQNPRFVLQKN